MTTADSMLVGLVATAAKWAAGWLVVAVVAVSGCRIAPEGEPLGQPVAQSEPEAEGLDGLDFDNAVYASACGLNWIEVGAGVGEGPSLGGIYGLEVIDVIVGDLDGESGVEAAVLVDCLGGDTYSAHVLGFAPDDLNFSDGGPAVLLPSTGGSLPSGYRPVGIESGADGSLTVELEGGDGLIERELVWSEHVMSGGELAALPGAELHGVIAAVEPGGQVVVSLAPGVGHRLATAQDLTAIDPDTGAELAPSEMSGRPARLTLDPEGAVATIELLAAGGA